MTEFILPNDTFAKAVAAAGVPEEGHAAFYARTGMQAEFIKAFPEAKRLLRGGYRVEGDGTETRVRAWFANHKTPISI